MNPKNYLKINLPKYIHSLIERSLIHFQNKLNNQPLEEILKCLPNKDLEKVNIILKVPKNPHFNSNQTNLDNIGYVTPIKQKSNPQNNIKTRDIMIPHPYLYYSLVRIITEPTNWNIITDCLSKFKNLNQSTEVASIPVANIRGNNYYPYTLSNYYHKYYKRIMDLSIDFKYFYVMDIKNCYPSIKLDLLEDALCCKNTPIENNNNKELAQSIINLVKIIQKGKDGVPIGTAIDDLVSEIILSYLDYITFLEIQNNPAANSMEYKFIRFKDDTVILAKDENQCDLLFEIYKQNLKYIGLELNEEKTTKTTDIYGEITKPDKLEALKRGYFSLRKFSKGKVKYEQIKNYEEKLNSILNFSFLFPNGGQIRRMLNELIGSLQDRLRPFKNIKRIPLIEDVGSLLSITLNIGEKNIKCIDQIAKLIGLLLYAETLLFQSQSQDITDNNLNVYRERIYKKFKPYFYIDFVEIWIHSILKNTNVNGEYDSYILKYFKEGENLSLFNNSWLNQELRSGCPYDYEFEENRNTFPVNKIPLKYYGDNFNFLFDHHFIFDYNDYDYCPYDDGYFNEYQLGNSGFNPFSNKSGIRRVNYRRNNFGRGLTGFNFGGNYSAFSFGSFMNNPNQNNSGVDNNFSFNQNSNQSLFSSNFGNQMPNLDLNTFGKRRIGHNYGNNMSDDNLFGMGSPFNFGNLPNNNMNEGENNNPQNMP